MRPARKHAPDRNWSEAMGRAQLMEPCSMAAPGIRAELFRAAMTYKMYRIYSISLLGLVLGLGGCRQGDEDAEPRDSAGAKGSESSTSQGDPSAPTDPQNPGDDTSGPKQESCDQQGLRLGVSSLRRLTPEQYTNSVQELFAPAQIEAPSLQGSAFAFGFSNFASQQVPSALVIQEFQRAALQVTTQALPEIESWTQCAATSQTQTCGEAFLERFLARAFRRPVDAVTLKPYLDFFRAKFLEHGFEVAISLSVQAVLQAPEFLYHIEKGTAVGDQGLEKLDDYSVASRLSYLIWNSLPDAALLDAASRGELSSAPQVAAQAKRMLADARASSMIRSFFSQWLDVHKLDTTSLDPVTYPSFNAQTPDLLREGLLRRVEHVVFSGQGTLKELLVDRHAWVSPELAQIYGVSHPGGETWQRVQLPQAQRAGLLTDAAWLASRAHAIHPSPVQRGIFVLERMLCEPSYPPPADADTTPPKADPQVANTNRQRYIQHVLDPACAGCHEPIDGIGMGFEHYDALGRWRDTDNGIEVDASGTLLKTAQQGPFDGALELSSRLSESSQVQTCVALQLFRYAMGRDRAEQDACQIDALQAAFVQSEGHLLGYIEALTASEAFRFRKVDTTP